MGALSSLRVTIGGAGVFGLCIAVELARRGARVTLSDPRPVGSNASSVAAGMLAPALEAALDPLMHGRFALLKQARDLWPAFAADLEGVRLYRNGAAYNAPSEALTRVVTRLRAEGAAFEADGQGLFTPEDWRIEAVQTLAALKARFADLGGILREGPVQTAPAGDAAVLACGWQALDLVPELSLLTPIRGQLLRFDGAALSGPVRRGPGAYVVPGEGGAVVGATMDEGVTDLSPDAAASERLLAAGLALAPELAGTAFRAEVGVRAAAPDGLPLVGPSLIEGVFVAAGARRNGWLLAPMVAGLMADRLEGKTGRTEAAAVMDSGRFGPTGEPRN